MSWVYTPTPGHPRTQHTETPNKEVQLVGSRLPHLSLPPNPKRHRGAMTLVGGLLGWGRQAEELCVAQQSMPSLWETS